MDHPYNMPVTNFPSSLVTESFFKSYSQDALSRLSEFKREGLLIVDLKDDTNLVRDEIIYGLKDYLNRSTRVHNAWEFNLAVKKLATNEKVMTYLRELYLREPIPYQTLNFARGTEQKTHSDTIHFQSSPSGYICVECGLH